MYKKTMTCQVKRVGGSLMITVPKKIADEIDIQEGDEVELDGLRKKKLKLSDIYGSIPSLNGWKQEDKSDIKDW